MLIILTCTFIQGHIHLNHEHNECSIVSETVQAVPIKFAVKIVRLKVNIIFSQSDDLDHNCVSNVTNVYLYNNTNNYIGQDWCDIQTWHVGRFMHGICNTMLILVSMTLTFMHGHSGSAEQTNERKIIISTAKQVMSIKLSTTVGHVFMTLTLKTFIWLDLTVLIWFVSRVTLVRICHGVPCQVCLTFKETLRQAVNQSLDRSTVSQSSIKSSIQSIHSSIKQRRDTQRNTHRHRYTRRHRQTDRQTDTHTHTLSFVLSH